MLGLHPQTLDPGILSFPDMKTSPASPDLPLSKRARALYETACTLDDDATGQSAGSHHLLEELRGLVAMMLEELRHSTDGIITQDAKAQFDILASSRAQTSDGIADVLMPGDLRLLSPRYLPGVERPVVVLLIDQEFETDEWTIVPLSSSDTPVRDGEWATDFDEPLLRVCCFWNARRVQGCVLEDSQHLASMDNTELAHCVTLLEDWQSQIAWTAADAARSAPPLDLDFDVRMSYVEQESEAMQALLRVRAFRPQSPTGSAAFLASATGGQVPHEQKYRLPGFGHSLTLRSAASDIAEVTLSGCGERHSAPLLSPVLVTGVGTHYPLTELVSVRVPMQELARGFWVSVGDYGWASLVAVNA